MVLAAMMGYTTVGADLRHDVVSHVNAQAGRLEIDPSTYAYFQGDACAWHEAAQVKARKGTIALIVSSPGFGQAEKYDAAGKISGMLEHLGTYEQLRCQYEKILRSMLLSLADGGSLFLHLPVRLKYKKCPHSWAADVIAAAVDMGAQYVTTISVVSFHFIQCSHRSVIAPRLITASVSDPDRPQWLGPLVRCGKHEEGLRQPDA
jgi:hypothetical protein